MLLQEFDSTLNILNLFPAAQNTHKQLADPYSTLVL